MIVFVTRGCDVIRSSFVGATWSTARSSKEIYVAACSCVWRDSWLVRGRNVTHSWVRLDPWLAHQKRFMYVKNWLNRDLQKKPTEETFKRDLLYQLLVRVCDVTHGSFVGVTGLIARSYSIWVISTNTWVIFTNWWVIFTNVWVLGDFHKCMSDFHKCMSDFHIQ